MKLFVTRVSQANVSVNGKVESAIANGLVAFVGLEANDDETIFNKMAERLVNLRVFEDDKGKLNYSIHDKKLAILCVPNFTLCANTDKGRRPSFEKSAPKDTAQKFFNDFCSLITARGIEVKKGLFGEHMDISLVMDGPVNIIL